MSIRAKESRGQDGWAVLEMNDLLNLLSGVSLLLSCDYQAVTQDENELRSDHDKVVLPRGEI
jgi:hypothetical protein